MMGSPGIRPTSAHPLLVKSTQLLRSVPCPLLCVLWAEFSHCPHTGVRLEPRLATQVAPSSWLQ